jgi:hypothetical protein
MSKVAAPAFRKGPGLDRLLQQGYPEWQVDGLIEDYAHYRRGEAAAISTAVEDVTGRPARSFASFARDYKAAFSQ